ncbi:MAG: isoprenylcysteine carboxylmethyltransferase family protein [Chloroflexi bacterium]|nr:isoprenylcysteine carboxylmethyltransferase family protein [Chloroflexota bacterium]
MTEQTDHADVKIHPPVLTLIHIGIAYAAKWLIPIPFAVPNILRTIGLPLAAIGFLLAVSALLEFRKAHTTVDPHGSVKSIVTSGIYRFTRNPIYAGFLLVLIGIPLNSGTYWGLLLAPVFIVASTILSFSTKRPIWRKSLGTCTPVISPA